LTETRPLAALQEIGTPALFVVLWSTGFIGAKLGLPFARPLTFLTLRFALVAALLVLLALATRAPWPRRRDLPAYALAGFLVHGLYLGGVFVAIGHGLPAGLAALIVSLQPLLTSTIAHRWLGERVGVRQWAGLALGFAGVYLVLRDKATAGEASAIAWTAITIGLIGITVGTIYQKRFGGAIDWRPALLIQYAAAAVLFGGGAFAFETRVVHWTPDFVFALLYLVVVLSLGAVWLYYFMIRRSAATRVVSLFYLTPPVTALMAFALFGEKLAPLALVGMAVCVAGVFLVNWRPAAR
jgi:drug/metabolite transporter (DMT)-like permease